MSEAADPFDESASPRWRARVSVLAADFTVESADRAALDLALEAFEGIPKHRFDRRPAKLAVRLTVSNHPRSWPRGAAPPRPALTSGAGLLCATVDAGNFAVVDPSARRAIVCLSNAMLRERYHARYELVELAFLTLAARVQSLVPLHAACVGAHGNGALLIGASGSGKSTLALHALAEGMQLLSEDSAFVALERLRVTGVPNYLHVGAPALRFLQSAELHQAITRSPTIERRSGTRKLELDLRTVPGRIARSPLRLAAIDFLSERPASRPPPLRRLEDGIWLRRLRREQPYASAQANWRAFERQVARVPAYELRRTEHPDVAIRLLRSVL